MSAERINTVAVVGSALVVEGDREYTEAQRLGRLLVDAGFRVVTGGRTGVMEAASRGAHQADGYVEGRTVGILPGHQPEEANRWVDVAIPTGLSIARNAIVAHSDALVAVGGGSGTLSEMAMAWKLGRPVVAISVGGIGERMGGQPIDERPGPGDDQVWPAESAGEAVELVERLLVESSIGAREIE